MDACRLLVRGQFKNVKAGLYVYKQTTIFRDTFFINDFDFFIITSTKHDFVRRLIV